MDSMAISSIIGTASRTSALEIGIAVRSYSSPLTAAHSVFHILLSIPKFMAKRKAPL